MRAKTILVALLLLPCALPAQRGSGSFRVLEWNVSDSAWLKNREVSRAVLRHADADILIWAQIHPGFQAADIKEFLSGLRGPQDTVWNVSFRGRGSLEHTAIASRYRIEELAEFDNIPFPTSGPGVAEAQPPDDNQPGVRAAVPSAGVVVTIGSRKLLVIGLHFTCCGVPGNWREYRRRIEASQLRKRIEVVLSRARVDGLIVAGDMNLVAGRAALDTILAVTVARHIGPLVRADALHADGWTDWTWDGRGTPFNGGRLDNVVYSSAALRTTMARIWDTEFMPADTLRDHGLESGVSRAINHHRPVVVDFQFR